MKKPKPILARMDNGGLAIRVVGFKEKDAEPYLVVETSYGRYGYIEDRDIKRLRAWCDDCLKKRT